MATDQLLIGQMAIAEIGSRANVTSTGLTPHGSVFNDGSVEALYLDMYYGATRDEALRAARWNFAKRTVAPTLWKASPGTPEFTAVVGPYWSNAYPAPPWLYSYLLPGDYIYAHNVIAQTQSAIDPPIFPVNSLMVGIPRGMKAPFEIGTDVYDHLGAVQTQPVKVVLTNQQNPIFQYTYQAVEESIWTSDFVMVMVLALAARVAIAITSDKQMAGLKLQAANSLITQARAADGNEGPTVLDHVPDWLRIRGVGGASLQGFDFSYPYGPLFSLIPYV